MRLSVCLTIRESRVLRRVPNGNGEDRGVNDKLHKKENVVKKWRSVVTAFLLSREMPPNGRIKNEW